MVMRVGLPVAGFSCCKVERVPVSDNHVAHSYKAPVPQQGDGALVVPRLLAFAEQRPFVEAFFHAVLHETPYGGFGGQGHPRSLELLLDFPHALAHLRPVRVQNVAENGCACVLP